MGDIKNNFIFEKKIIPVILAGGIGTRLWPLSRASYPKQFLNLDQKNNFSLLQNTYLRLAEIENLGSPIIICNEDYRFIVAEQMRKIGIKPNSIILEPESKKYLPSDSLAALKTLNDSSSESVLLILSADHIIKNSENLKKAIKKGLKFAEQGRLVTFGVSPTHPETGYGYIESSHALSTKNHSSKIKRFIEKPKEELAKELIKNSAISWNSGIFLFSNTLIINEINKNYPEIISFCKESFANNINDLEFLRINQEIFSKCPEISIDKAVMENTKLGTVTRLDAGWSDIGSWKTLWERIDKDKSGNGCEGKTIIRDSENCYLRSEKRLIVAIGIKNLAVIETKDAVLVTEINQSQKVKDISELDNQNYLEGKFHNMIFRPWGKFTTIEENKNWKVKKIEIKPGASISLQLHEQRSEHWIVVCGVAYVEIDGKFYEIKENESIYVPRKCKHRLSNNQKSPLIIIEIQSGSYLGEDDIIRFNDMYGRI